MGQYYNAIITTEDNRTIRFSRRTKAFDVNVVESVSIAPKLNEHGYIGNEYTESVCQELYDKKVRVAWVGDYADDVQEYIVSYDETIAPITTTEAYRGEVEERPFGLVETIPLNESGYKYILNHSQKEYIDIDEYCLNSRRVNECTFQEDVLHPIPLLTAIGNGQGGGDYYGVNKAEVGRWVYDLLEISNNLPSEYSLLDVYFNEYEEDV